MIDLHLLKDAFHLAGSIILVAAGTISSVSDFINAKSDDALKVSLIKKLRYTSHLTIFLSVSAFIAWFVVSEDPGGWRLAMPMIPIMIILGLADIIYLTFTRQPSPDYYEVRITDKIYSKIGNTFGADIDTSVVIGRVIMNFGAILGVLSLSVNFAGKSLS